MNEEMLLNHMVKDTKSTIAMNLFIKAIRYDSKTYMFSITPFKFFILLLVQLLLKCLESLKRRFLMKLWKSLSP